MLFGDRTDEKRSAAIRALKESARVLMDARDDDAVVVNELRCVEPGCPPVETVIALLRPGAPPRQIKVHKPAVEVTAKDLRTALHRGHHHEPRAKA